MSEPFLAEIRIVGFNYPPRGWAFCDGQLLPINQNQSLYALLGTTYGGDGRVSFALPDLRGRTPVHRGDGYQLGQKGGEETHTLDVAELPGHQHTLQGTDANANAPILSGGVLAAFNNAYRALTETVEPRSGTVASAGGGQAHDNMQPALVLSFCIALQGLFPSRS